MAYVFSFSFLSFFFFLKKTTTNKQNKQKIKKQPKVVSVTKTILKKQLNAPDEYDMTPLHYASMHGNTEIVKLLLAENVPIDSRTAKGDTALIIASLRGYLVSIFFFVSHFLFSFLLIFSFFTPFFRPYLCVSHFLFSFFFNFYFFFTPFFHPYLFVSLFFVFIFCNMFF